MSPILYMFSGLPGTGKSTIAKSIASYYKATYLRLDTIEHGINELCKVNVEGEGYRLSYRIAADNLLIGNFVVADCCNPWHLTRTEWKNVAVRCRSKCLAIEIICSDKNEHRIRVESRVNDIDGFILPDWSSVLERSYQEWTTPIIRIDTAGKTVEESIKELITKISVFEL